MTLSRLLKHLRPSTRSLKLSLALYFLPLSVLPALLISIYATSLFERSAKETLQRRAESERDAIIAEIDRIEENVIREAKAFATSPRLLSAIALQNTARLDEVLESVRKPILVRLYSTTGSLISERTTEGFGNQIAYLSKSAVKTLMDHRETLDRFPMEGGSGFIILARFQLRDRERFYGFLEEQLPFGTSELTELRSRRNVDMVILDRKLNPWTSSFAVPKAALMASAQSAILQSQHRDAARVDLAGARFSVYLYDLPAQRGKIRDWAYLALFVPMNSIDTSLRELTTNTIYGTLFLTFISALLILLFSQRLVKPIELLVSAMKRVKTGNLEQIPPIDSTYEIEYLVRSFNEMIRNIGAAKRTLELKLDELHHANSEIKETQSHLVQSAKLISLGELVAGVAHELNNPIAFIYSNMHHLLEYLAKIKRLIAAYQETCSKLSETDRKRLLDLEAQIELDYLLKDTEDLVRSCLDGADRTKNIVLGLRTFSRMEDASFQGHDIHDGIRNTLRLLGAELKNRITVHEDFGDLPNVQCNLSQLNQVFMNLLTNAAQAIDGRGTIWIRTLKIEDNIQIEIEDSGRGIPHTIIDKIFDPFFTTKKTGQGTGLGLSIAYGLIQKHHGKISVKSAPGKGTRFTITLPISQPLPYAKSIA